MTDVSDRIERIALRNAISELNMVSIELERADVYLQRVFGVDQIPMGMLRRDLGSLLNELRDELAVRTAEAGA